MTGCGLRLGMIIAAVVTGACEKDGGTVLQPVPADAAAERPVPAPAPPPADPCRGADLDLTAIAASGSCLAPDRDDSEFLELPKDLPIGWEIRVEPNPVEVRSGQRVPARLAFVNTTAHPLVLLLTVSTLQATIEARAVDQQGKRQDLRRPAKSCEGGYGIGRSRETRVTVEPAGRASVRFDYEAIVYDRDRSCRDHPAGPLASGRYRLRVKANHLGRWRSQRIIGDLVVAP